MVIGIDGLVFQTKLTGVGKYYLGILNEIRIAVPEAQFILFSNKSVPYLPDEWAGTKLVIDSGYFEKMKYIIWLKLFAGRLICQHNIDFYFSCNTFLPRLLRSVKAIGIVHDLNYVFAPETMPFSNYLAHKLFMKSDVSKADFLITNSYATEKKAQQILNVVCDEVVYPKISPVYRPMPVEIVTPYLQANGINFPYILSVATLEPRKNIHLTIKSFLELKDQGELAGFKMILVGGKGWKNKEVEELIAKHDDVIVSLGYVSDEFLAYLYNGASLFVFPSKYEGFGIPVREAIQSGCKVLASNIDELIEVGSPEAFHFDLQAVHAYTESIKKTLSDSSHRQRNYSDSKISALTGFLRSSG